MSRLSDLRNEVQKCNQFLTVINNAIGEIENARSQLENACQIKSYFQIDGASADAGDIKKEQDHIANISSSLNYATGSVQNRIDYLNAEIRKEEERIRREEERRRREAKK